ncbi:metal-sensitive transcriptional regulator [bacterium]|nr:metal-sensitive transcriptional regulator [bacterium]
MNNQNPDHKKTLHRINRLKGQLDGVARMIKERKYCPDILQQTKAIKSAIKSLEAALLEGHLKHCVKNAYISNDDQEQESKIKELLQLYLKNT